MFRYASTKETGCFTYVGHFTVFTGDFVDAVGCFESVPFIFRVYKQASYCVVRLHRSVDVVLFEYPLNAFGDTLYKGKNDHALGFDVISPFATLVRLLRFVVHLAFDFVYCPLRVTACGESLAYSLFFHYFVSFLGDDRIHDRRSRRSQGSDGNQKEGQPDT